MDHLIDNITWRKGEDTLTEVLAFILNNFHNYRSAFLSLINPFYNYDNCTVSTQYQSDSSNRPDLFINDNKKQWVIYVENKPWNTSLPTTGIVFGDQLKRYAEKILEEKHEQKTLCLLATDTNKDQLLKITAQAENISTKGISYEDSLIIYYKNKGINFKVIIWKDVIQALQNAKQKGAINDPVADFLINNLGHIFKDSYISSDTITAKDKFVKNYESLKDLTAKAKLLLDQSGIVKHYYDGGGKKNGFYLYRMLVPEWGCFAFGPDTISYEQMLKEDVNPKHILLFSLSTENKDKTRFDILSDKVLHECGFTKYKNFYRHWIYVKQLDINFDDNNGITPKFIADAVMKIVKQLTEVYYNKTIENMSSFITQELDIKC